MENEEAARRANSIFAAAADQGLYGLVVNATARSGPGPIHIDVTIQHNGATYRSLRELIEAVIEAPARLARAAEQRQRIDEANEARAERADARRARAAAAAAAAVEVADTDATVTDDE